MGQTIDRLYALMCEGDVGLDEAQRERMFGLECAYALAVEGTGGSLLDVRRELEAFLADY